MRYLHHCQISIASCPPLTLSSEGTKQNATHTRTDFKLDTVEGFSATGGGELDDDALFREAEKANDAAATRPAALFTSGSDAYNHGQHAIVIIPRKSYSGKLTAAEYGLDFGMPCFNPAENSFAVASGLLAIAR